jgi:predicted CopG family antitoxin
MAVKTITIDMEAYDTLSRHKRAGQSFSQVIKAHFGARPTAGRLLERLKTIRLSTDALDAMDEVVRDRKRHPARVIQLERAGRGR